MAALLESHETDMSASASAIVKRILDPVLSPVGFIRKGSSYFRESEAAILVVNLQSGSDPGPYLNLGVYYLALGTHTRPDITECHLWTRLEALAPIRSQRTDLVMSRLSELVDPKTDISDYDRANELQQLVLTYALPWLNGVARFDTARSFLATQSSRPVYVAASVRDHFEGTR